jgi:hypothetical protein
MSRVLQSSRAGEKVLLLCLDTLTLGAEADCDDVVVPVQPWAERAAGLLAHARAEGWGVAHVVSPRPPPGRAGWRAAPGLAPRPSEPVYHRAEPSAFSQAALCALIEAAPRTEVVLCGVSLAGSGLATALEAHPRGASVTIAADAIWLAPPELAGLEGILRLQRLGHLPHRVRLAPAEALARPWARLRVVQGGRA